MTTERPDSAAVHLRVRVSPELRSGLRALAGRRRLSVSQVLREVITSQLIAADSPSGSLPDESAIREMAILIAVELVLKLQEASIPGGISLSRRLLEDAARAAIERLETVGRSLQREAIR